MALSKKASSSSSDKLCFPWLLWHIWIARYEKVHYDGAAIFAKASEESASWLNLQLLTQESICSAGPSRTQWQKPPVNIVECNMATSWIDKDQNFGAAWLVRDSQGVTNFSQ